MPGGVSIIIPTLNEGENIDAVLDAIVDTIGVQFAYEVLVVDDGSTDDTRARAVARAMSCPVRLIARDQPTGGLTGAVVEGAANARYSVVVVMDGDGSHPASALPELVAPVLAGTRDIVVGSRRVAGGGTPDWPWYRRLASRTASAAAWPISDVGDPMSGFFATTRARLAAVDSKAKGFKIGLEVMAAGGGALRTAEVPIVFHDRQYGESKMRASTLVHYGTRLVALGGGETRFRHVRRYAFAATVGMLADVGLFTLLASWGAGSVALTSIFSALIAAAVTYGLNRWSRVPTCVSGARRLLRALSVGLMAAALRGGLVALASTTQGAPHWLAAIGCFALPAAINFAGSVFYVFAPLRSGDHHVIRWRVGAAALAVYALLMHLVYLGVPALLPEEAYYWNYAQYPALSYLDHPPMVGWLIWLGTALCGDVEWGVRLPALLCWGGAGLFVYRLTRELYDKSAAIVALALVAVLPFFASTGLFMTPDAPLLLCWAATLYYLARALGVGPSTPLDSAGCETAGSSPGLVHVAALDTPSSARLAQRPLARLRSDGEHPDRLPVSGRMGAWAGVGLWLGLGMLSKYSIVLLGPATGLFMLIDASARRQWARPQPYLSIVLGLAIFTPVLVWNANHDWISFWFQSARRVAEPAEFGLGVLVLASLLFMTPPGLVAAYRGLRRGVATDRVADEARRRRIFLGAMTLVPLLVFVAASIRSQSKANWTGPVWLAAVPVIAAIILHGVTAVRARAMSRRWALTLSAVVIGTAFVLHYLAIGLPGVGYRDDLRMPVGWRAMATAVERIEDQLREQGHGEPVAVGLNKYSLAAELAFYRRAPERTASLNLFGEPALMYELWPVPPDLAQRPLVLVSHDEANLLYPEVERRITKGDPVRRHVIRRDGRIVATFFTRVVWGYSPAR